MSGQLGVDDTHGERGLDADLLAVGGGDPEDVPELHVVDRNLGEAGVERPEPERGPGAAVDQFSAPSLEERPGGRAGGVGEERVLK